MIMIEIVTTTGMAIWRADMIAAIELRSGNIFVTDKAGMSQVYLIDDTIAQDLFRRVITDWEAYTCAPIPRTDLTQMR